jgi:hypothetical protein
VKKINIPIDIFLTSEDMNIISLFPGIPDYEELYAQQKIYIKLKEGENFKIILKENFKKLPKSTQKYLIQNGTFTKVLKKGKGVKNV